MGPDSDALDIIQDNPCLTIDKKAKLLLLLFFVLFFFIFCIIFVLFLYNFLKIILYYFCIIFFCISFFFSIIFYNEKYQLLGIPLKDTLVAARRRIP